MRIQLCALLSFCALLFGANLAFASPGHDHGSHSHEPINAKQAKSVATKIVHKLVEKNKLAASWKNVSAPAAETKTYAGKKEWRVSFNNPAVKDSAKQNLYIFLTINGDYVAANFSGK